MSFRDEGKQHVVECDVCGSHGSFFRGDWREVRRDAQGERTHLCRTCYVYAEWCEEHQRYHLMDDMHRCACAECGGLFTSAVRAHSAYCPSCARVHQAPRPVLTAVVEPAKDTPPARGWWQRLLG